MLNRTHITTRAAILLIAAAALTATACTVDKQKAPSLSGPSEFGLSIGLTASPDVLPRDGSSVSLIKVVARDSEGKPVAGQRLVLGATAGTLSVGEVTTASNGEASFQITAPAASVNASIAVVSATPVGTNFDNAATRSISIALAGPSVPTVSFTSTPASPGQFDLVTFDASGTTLNGSACGSSCTYSWNFGDGFSAQGQVATHRFSTRGTFTVTLTVTSPDGVVVASTRNVAVGAPAAITAQITPSPTNPRVLDTVRFDGSGSSTPDGTAIVSYSWDFGNGSTAEGRTASTQYTAARTYTVRLTIVDALGRTATTTVTITVT